MSDVPTHLETSCQLAGKKATTVTTLVSYRGLRKIQSEIETVMVVVAN
ncbi:hypothetical protein PL10110_340074 [Planktothrix agardhii]|nr:hypothetical protein PL10110_340074 [Planktothrix agardhii]